MVIEEFGAANDPLSVADGALFAFHRANAKYPGSQASKITGAQFVDHVEKEQPGWRRHFGSGIIASELQPVKVASAMTELASKFRGRIPNRRGFNKIFDALMGKLTSFDLARDAVSEGIKETASDTVEVAKSVGSSVSTALKIAPLLYVAGGVVALMIFAKSRSLGRR